MFVDSAKITVKSGKGGNGAVSFRTEKNIPNGGPDGGDGGKGGDVVFFADEGVRTLKDFRYKRRYVARDGENGKKSKCNGAAAENLEIALPVGSVIKDSSSDRVLADLCKPKQRFIAAEGGKGGKGNVHFANSVRQAPKFAGGGEPGEEMELSIELKVLADVGLIGFPNVGKSTLLSVISSAKPKIADYHFTTLQPNLGVCDYKDSSFIIADIPGLVEGASRGVGLGLDFLKHIERTKMFVHVIDVSGSEGRDPVNDYYSIKEELKTYDEKLLKKPRIIAANKIDLADEEKIEKFEKEMKDEEIEIFYICAPINEGIDELKAALAQRVQNLPEVVLYDDVDRKVVYKLEDEGFRVERKNDAFHVTGKEIERIVNSTNFDDVESMQYFQRILRKKGIIDELEKNGIKQGDTVVIYSLEFEYIK